MQLSQSGAGIARQAADSRLLTLLGRVGLVAYGVVNLLVGYLASKIAFSGDRSGQADKSGALHTVASQPGGKVLLWVITIGLVALVLWQIAEAAWGYHAASTAGRRRTRRLTSLAQAAVFAVVALTSAKVAAGGAADSTSAQQEALTARLLELPMGQILVGLIGGGVVVAAGFLVRRGVKQKFTEDLDLGRASQIGSAAAIRLGQVGYVALGAAYCIVGVLVALAAITFDPDKAAGLDQALSTLARQPHGPMLLGAIAMGLFCYGGYCLFDARYRRG